jgi:transcriptional regulator with XRE-family HTH domain
MPKQDRILSILGINVRKARDTKHLTQEKLAESAGLDPTYISGIERGSGWPVALELIGVEAWWRFENGQITSEELYCTENRRTELTSEEGK